MWSLQTGFTVLGHRFQNWPNSQMPECIYSISHNAPFRTEICTFLFSMEHCGISNRCILGFVKLVCWNGTKYNHDNQLFSGNLLKGLEKRAVILQAYQTAIHKAVMDIFKHVKTKIHAIQCSKNSNSKLLPYFTLIYHEYPLYKYMILRCGNTNTKSILLCEQREVLENYNVVNI